MPEIHESTPREVYTIAGESFSIPQPYGAGHRLTEGEASQLNQVYAENVRNNKASKVKELKEAGTFDQTVFQGEVDDYCESYEMGVRTGGGRTGDPVMAEALNIARDAVRKAIVKKGIRLADVSAKLITEQARKAIDKNPQILETARARVEATKDIAEIELGNLEPETAAEEAQTSAPAKGRAKASA